MEKFEEKIIDLVDVVAEPVPGRMKEMPAAATVPVQESESSSEKEPKDLEILVRKEVERLLKSTINENIQGIIKEILTQEIEKAIAREIEFLKKT
jgi:hypothetical protein